MGKNSGAPAAPDPAKMAAAQGEQDRKTMQLYLNNSRTTTVNPFGSTSWKNNKTFDQAGFDKAMAAYNSSPGAGPAGTLIHAGSQINGGSTRLSQDMYQGADGEMYTPEQWSSMSAGAKGPAPDRSAFEGPDSWTNTQTLSPESQGIYDTATAKLGDATKNISTDPSAYNATVAQAIRDRMTRLAQPGLDQQRNDTRTRLADSGFQVGNEGYNQEMNRMDTNQGQTAADIADRAQITGAQQGLQEQSMQQQIAKSLQSLRDSQVQGVSGMPTTTSTPQQQPFDISGAMMQQYQDQLQSANANNASNNGLMGSLIQAGAMMAAPSTGGMSMAAGSLLPQFAGVSTPNYGMTSRLPNAGFNAGVR